MPKTAAKFGQELQLALQPMILKPSPAAGVLVSPVQYIIVAMRMLICDYVQGLQETVACICAAVHHLTHDFGRLIALLRSCNGAFHPHISIQVVIEVVLLARLHQSIQKPAVQTMAPSEQRALTVLLFITSLLCEHCNFDRLRSEEESEL